METRGRAAEMEFCANGKVISVPTGWNWRKKWSTSEGRRPSVPPKFPVDPRVQPAEPKRPSGKCPGYTRVV